MELFLMNTTDGLKPMFDTDFDEKKKLKLGQSYKAKITKARNIDFHRKYFALINCAWEYMNEKQCEFFKNNSNLFRKTVQVSAGFYTPLYSIKRKEWIEEPTSISFDKMDNVEFEELYTKVRDVIFTLLEKTVSQEEFEQNLINF